MNFDHIGYLSSDIEKSIQTFQQLGYRQVTEIFKDNQPDGDNAPARNVYICFLENDATRIELVSPINEKSDIYVTLQRQGEGPYHLCYRTEDLDAQIDKLKQQGWLVLRNPAKAVAFQYARVAFFFKKGIGLMELAEIKK